MRQNPNSQLLRSHGLLEPEEHSAQLAQDQAQHRKRLTERQRLFQLKTEHELQKGSHRKVLCLEGDGEGTGSGKKDKGSAGEDMDIQEVKFKLRHNVSESVRICHLGNRLCSDWCCARACTHS
ncbi:hypothetical protein SRHO_G00232950 [Serrasalmus rhombeus]